MQHTHAARESGNDDARLTKRAERLEGVTLPLGVEPVFLSVGQTCLATSLGRSTVFGLIADGSLDTVLVNGRRLVRLRSVQALGSKAE